MGLSGVDTSFSRLKDSSHLHALSKQHWIPKHESWKIQSFERLLINYRKLLIEVMIAKATIEVAIIPASTRYTGWYVL